MNALLCLGVAVREAAAASADAGSLEAKAEPAARRRSMRSRADTEALVVGAVMAAAREAGPGG